MESFNNLADLIFDNKEILGSGKFKKIMDYMMNIRIKLNDNITLNSNNFTLSTTEGGEPPNEIDNIIYPEAAASL